MPIQPYATLHWFINRLRQVLPEQEGIVSLNAPTEIKTVLDAVLQSPLVYDAERDGLPSDVLWWFRGSRSYFIRDYTLDDENVLTLHMPNYRIRMAVVGVDVVLSEVLDMNFVHLRCDPLPCELSPEQIQSMVQTTGFAREIEYYIPSTKRTLRYGEYNPDARYAEEAIEVDFHVSLYNVFIAPKESRLNNTGSGGTRLEKACNALLAGQIQLADFVQVLSNYPMCGYTQNLIRLSKPKT